MNVSDALNEVLRSERFLYATVIDHTGRVVASAGDAHAFPSPHLVSALLGPLGDPKQTFLGLVDQPLPQIWGQGSSLAIADLLSPQLAVLFFGVPRPTLLSRLLPRSTQQHARWQYALSRRVAQRFRTLTVTS